MQHRFICLVLSHLIDIRGVFAHVAHGLGCTPESAHSCLASLCSPSARPPRAKKGLSTRLCSYAKFHRSWRARLRGAQSSRFGGCFELLARLQVESKHNLKTGRLSWAIAPNIREWPDLAWLRLATAWALGRTSHDHPSKHTLGFIIKIEAMSYFMHKHGTRSTSSKGFDDGDLVL
jgi:hypothetical protein